MLLPPRWLPSSPAAGSSQQAHHPSYALPERTQTAGAFDALVPDCHDGDGCVMTSACISGRMVSVSRVRPQAAFCGVTRLAPELPSETANQPTLDAEKLVKVLGMLGSAHRGEVTAAGLAAHKLITEAGLRWPDQIKGAKARR
jgi:hypothetical protein